MEGGKVSYTNDAVVMEGVDGKENYIKDFQGVEKIEQAEEGKENQEEVRKKNRPEKIVDLFFRLINIVFLIVELVLNMIVYAGTSDADPCEAQFKTPWLAFTIVGFILGAVQSGVIAVQTYQEIKYGYSKIELEFENFAFNFLKDAPQTGLMLYYVLMCGCSPSEPNSFYLQFSANFIEYVRIWARKFLLLRNLQIVCCQCHIRIKYCCFAFVYPPGNCICLCCQGSCCPKCNPCFYDYWRLKAIWWNKLLSKLQFLALVVSMIIWFIKNVCSDPI